MIIVELKSSEINRFILLAQGSNMKSNYNYDSFRCQSGGFAICEFQRIIQYPGDFWLWRFIEKLPSYMEKFPIFSFDDFDRALQRNFANNVFTSTPGNPAPCLKPPKECNCKNLLAGHDVGCYFHR